MLHQMPEEFEPVHARHNQVRHDHIGIEGSQALQSVYTVGSELYFEMRAGKHRRQSYTLVFVVIDDEYPTRNTGSSGHFALVYQSPRSGVAVSDVDITPRSHLALFVPV